MTIADLIIETAVNGFRQAKQLRLPRAPIHDLADCAMTMHRDGELVSTGGR